MAIKKKKVSPDKALVLGIDPSLNGAGFVVMKNSEVMNYYFFTDVVKVSKASPNAILNRSKGSERLSCILDFYKDILNKFDFDYIAIEDYAYGAKSNSIFQIGGVGEILRLFAFRAGIPYREYEPSKVKKFATSKGNAEKSQMVLEAYKSGFDVGQYGKSGEDLADAYWIARMLSTELKLHFDSEFLKQLPKHQAEVFTETSKAYPTPIINRPFVSDRGD